MTKRAREDDYELHDEDAGGLREDLAVSPFWQPANETYS